MSPEQHPSGHWQPLQTPAAHDSPDLHAAHVMPAPPHSAVVLPGSQVVPLQHPVGHDEGVHWHWPDTHCCPAPQAALDPHWQLPDALQPSLVEASQPVQTHTPALQERPGGQGRPVPQAGPRPL